MACEDTRQLTEAQRQAAYQQQRTGVPQAVRPFQGRPTLDNLLDYINRELVPAVRQTRSAVNDVFLQVTDNAPSANPLSYYFSTETAAADPTEGRLRLNASPQSGATVIYISQTNGRLDDVSAWLDVMAGGATEPLGSLSILDAINPGRSLRFDLDTMVDQGDYWELGVTLVEASHDDPFVEGEGLVLAFTPAIASSGATVPPGAISPIATDTFIGNISGSTAAPSAVPLASVDSTSITYDGASHEFRRAALTGAITSPANSNATLFDTGASGAGLTGGGTAVLAVGAGTGITVAADSVSVTTPLTDGDKGDITVASNGTDWQIDADVVTNTELANMAAGRVKGKQIDASSGDPVDLTGAEVGELIRYGTVQTETLTPSSTTNDLTVNADTTVLAFNHSTGIVTVTGFTGGALGRTLVILNTSGTFGASLFIPNFTGSSGANRVRTPGGGDLTLRDREGCILWSDGSTCWRVLGVAKASATADRDYGDITVTDGGITWTIDNDAVSNAKLRNSGALSVIGRSANSSGDPADISATAASGAVLRESGSVLGFGTISLAAFPAIADDTFLANIAGSSTQPTAVALSTLAGAGLTGGANAVLAVGAGTGITVNANDVAVTIPLTDGDKGEITVASSGTSWTIDAGVVTETKLSASVAGDGLTGGAGTPLAVGAGTGITVTANAVAVTVPLTDGDKGDITVSSSGTAWAIDNAAVTLAKMENRAAGTVIGRQIDAGSGVPVALTGAEVAEIIRWSNALSDAVGGTYTDHALDTLVDQWRFTATATITGIANGSEGRLLVIENAANAGSGITVTLVHFATSSNANRLINSTNADIVLHPSMCATYRYIASRWRLIGLTALQLTDGDKGDITVATGGTAWTIDNDAVTTAKILDANVTLAKMANLAQSRFIGRAEGAGTGVPVALTPTQAVAIIDGESPTWTGVHSFTGSSHDIDVTGAVSIDADAASNFTTSVGNLTLSTTAASTRVIVSGADDVLIEAVADDVFINSGGTTQVSATANFRALTNSTQRLDISSAGAWDIDGSVVNVDTTGDITLNAGDDLTLAATTQVQVTSPFLVQTSCRFNAIASSTMNAGVNNFDVSSVNVARLTPATSSRNLTGMVAGGDGQFVLVVNASATLSVRVVDETDGTNGTDSTAANRFNLGGSTSASIPPRGLALFWYDGTTDRWRGNILG